MYQTTILPNGATILTLPIPGVRSAALGFFVGVGSRHEKAAENGAAHFIEHMVFKGTGRRSAGDLAREMDAIGGQVNAYTTKEHTCFYARCLDEHLDRAADLLLDMLFSSRFDQKDVEMERGVVLEEIGMYEDAPEDLVSERLAAVVYKGSPLARPILGRASTLAPMTGQWLKAWLCRREREKYQKEELSVEYNEKHPEPAYHCGALVAVFGEIQRLAMKDVNASIIDRYYASAIQTPALVLGQLSKLSNHHLDKLSEPRRKEFTALRDQAACAIGDRIPTVLRPEQQSYFALGYYQMGTRIEKDRRARIAAAAEKKAD